MFLQIRFFKLKAHSKLFYKCYY